MDIILLLFSSHFSLYPLLLFLLSLNVCVCTCLCLWWMSSLDRKLKAISSTCFILCYSQHLTSDEASVMLHVHYDNIFMSFTCCKSVFIQYKQNQNSLKKVISQKKAKQKPLIYGQLIQEINMKSHSTLSEKRWPEYVHHVFNLWSSRFIWEKVDIDF